MQTYRWATLGCGVIANELAQVLASRGQKLYSVANRTHAKAVAFAEKYGIEKVYDQIDDVFADENVDIIYISTPHNTHIQYLRTPRLTFAATWRRVWRKLPSRCGSRTMRCISA